MSFFDDFARCPACDARSPLGLPCSDWCVEVDATQSRLNREWRSGADTAATKAHMQDLRRVRDLRVVRADGVRHLVQNDKLHCGGALGADAEPALGPLPASPVAAEVHGGFCGGCIAVWRERWSAVVPRVVAQLDEWD